MREIVVLHLKHSTYPMIKPQISNKVMKGVHISSYLVQMLLLLLFDCDAAGTNSNREERGMMRTELMVSMETILPWFSSTN